MSDGAFRSFYPAHTSKSGDSLDAGGGAVSMDTKEMKQALTLLRRPVSSDPLTPPHVSMPDPFNWATSLARHTCVSVESGEHYRLQSAVASDQWPTIALPPLP